MSEIRPEFMHTRRVLELQRILDKAVKIFWSGEKMNGDLRAELRFALEKIKELGRDLDDFRLTSVEQEFIKRVGELDQEIPVEH